VVSPEPPSLPRAAQRVADALKSRGHTGEIRLLGDSARSAAEAAEALGVDQQQIVKSLVFRARQSDQPILALIGGTSRVDPQLLAQHVGEPVERAEAGWVREQTGFAIGGVPPLAHSETPTILVDADLLAYDELWAAAGSPYSVFRLTPTELISLTEGTLAEVAEGRP
jgi:prolyl-tRNA editing enzyme YbaK/EbsC (Cys-tRNA(Pro) deacylase)